MDTVKNASKNTNTDQFEKGEAPSRFGNVQD
jgi:hypothetical protein